ncbi:MAG: hypothetical protein ISQ34_00775 [Rickettsiales bacterium]|nr:hypothetical protein [Rickettsiales bacterium]
MRKKILIIYGKDINYIHRVVNKLHDSTYDLDQIKLADFWQRKHGDGEVFDQQYDQIIIHAHGNRGLFAENDGLEIRQATRSGHIVSSQDGLLLKTASVVELCLQNSANIIVDSCYAGAVMKDLALSDLACRAGVVVLSYGGSKHTIIQDEGKYLIEAELRDKGIQEVIAQAYRISPDTIGYMVNGAISKLGAIKIEDGNVIRKKSILIRSSLSWEEKIEERIIFDHEGISSLGADFKVIAFGLAIFRNKERDARFWYETGCNVHAKVFRAGESEAIGNLCALEGNVERLNLLMKICGDQCDKASLIFSASVNSCIEAMEYLIGISDPKDLNLESLRIEKNPLMRAAFHEKRDVLDWFIKNRSSDEIAMGCDAVVSMILKPLEKEVMACLFPMIVASGNVKAVDNCLKSEVIDINAKAENEQTPLMIAVGLESNVILKKIASRLSWEQIKENFDSILEGDLQSQGQKLLVYCTECVETLDSYADRVLQKKDLKKIAKDFSKKGWDVPEKFQTTSVCSVM